MICGSSTIASQADCYPRSGLGVIDIHANNEEAFRFACINGHLEVAKWLLYISEKKKLICGSSAIALQADRYPRSGLETININAIKFAFHWTCANNHFHIARWLLTLYTKKELIKINYSPLTKEELENRKKTNIELILYLYEQKFKLLDIHAIAIVWREYL